MSVTATLPVQRAPLIDNKGCMTLPYYRYFLGFNNNQSSANTNYQQQISQIATDLGSPDGSVDSIPPITFDTGSIEGIDSIAVSGTLQNKGVVKISLEGDSSFKQQGSFYGFANNQMGFFLLQNILQAKPGVTVSTSNLGITTLGTDLFYQMACQ